MAGPDESGAEASGSDPADGDAPPSDEQLRDQRLQRLAKLDALRAEGVDPYPVRFDPDTTAAALRDRYGDLEPGVDTGTVVRLAGRIVLLRRQGKLSFATVQDRDGTIQLFVNRRVVGDDAHDAFDRLDRGDWVGVTGTVMTTKRGELSIGVQEFQLLSKALRPLPEKWHGLSDVDTRYRQRYVDLVVNEDARRIALARIDIIGALRAHLVGSGYREVEGPVLQTIQGGGTAKPFTTHHNALGQDMYLRIALELHLKRLIVGGLDRVFEIGRVFRNEGVDTTHNPEFTMLEAYRAFGDYTEMIELAEGLVVDAARAVLPDLRVEYAGHEIDLTPPFRRATMAQLITEVTGSTLHPSMSVEDARKVAKELDVDVEPEWGSGRITMEVYDAHVEDTLIQPTLVLDHPRETSPLARAHRDDPTLVERFELVVAGHELMNAYSELNDPVDQLAAVRGGSLGQAARRPRGRRRRPRLRASAGVRHAAHGRDRSRRGPSGDVAHRHAVDPRGHPVPDAAPGTGDGRSRELTLTTARRGPGSPPCGTRGRSAGSPPPPV